MSKALKLLLSLLLLSGGVLSQAAPAAEAPQLVLQMKKELLAGHIKDGTRLGKGIIISHDDHAGFSLWSTHSPLTLQPGHYQLKGKQSAAHLLNVRLEPEQRAVTEGQNLIVNTSQNRLTFNIIADGDQTPAADSYTLSLDGALLKPSR